MTPVGRNGRSSRYDAKSANYVDTTKQYKELVELKDREETLRKFNIAARALLPSRRRTATPQ